MYSVPSLYHAAVCASTGDNTQDMRAVVSEEVTRMGPYLRNFGKSSRVRRTPFQVVFIRPRRLGR
jgi:hypothetical protein